MIVTTSKRISRTRRISSLAAVDLFKRLPRPVIRELEKISQVQEVQSGHIFFNPGETGYALFILEKGVVRTFRTLGTKKLVIVNLKSPDVFGEMGCIGKCQYHCTAEALQPSRVRTIRRSELDAILKRFPEVTRRLLDLVGQRFFHVLMDLEATLIHSLIARAARLLLERADGDRIHNITHKEIAEHLHVYRESATEALGELRRAGIITVRRREIRILHRGRLERAAREWKSMKCSPSSGKRSTESRLWHPDESFSERLAQLT
jgi:CRP/FNR family cyclic AMP-dependent transcriptional regulator